MRVVHSLRLLVLAGMVTALPAMNASAQNPRPAGACPALLQHQFARLQDDAPQHLCQYTGKVVLVVNTASYCGFTRQYEGLEALHDRFAPRGLVILGFPSNDFGQQEPGNAREIAELCFNTYGVKFPMFNKTAVAGAQRNAFYAQLFEATRSAPQWNFHKYLIGRDGKTVTSFPSAVEPGSAPLLAAIERALQQPTR